MSSGHFSMNVVFSMTDNIESFKNQGDRVSPAETRYIL